MALRSFLTKVLFVSFFSRAFCNSPSLTASPSVMATSSQSNATSSANGSNAITPGLRGTNTAAQSTRVDATKTEQSSGSNPTSTSVSGPSFLSPSISGSSPVSGGSLDQYLQTLTQEQRVLVENFEKKRKDVVNGMEIEFEIKPKETSEADKEYLSSVNTLLQESLNVGYEFNKLEGDINYSVITKSNALQAKKFDCLKNRLSMFPEIVNPRTIGAAANHIALPLECPVEVIKESRRRRREVVISIEMDVGALPAVPEMADEEPTHYTHMYRYLRRRRDAEANQNDKGVCLQKASDHCLDARLKVTFTILSEVWKSEYNNKDSQDFKAFTKRIEEAMKQSVDKNISSVTVSFHSFELRSGSVVVSLFADTLNATASDLKTYLERESSFGTQNQFNVTLTNVTQVKVVHGGWTDFSQWPDRSTADRNVCGNDFRVKRSRNCTNPMPKYGGKECEGPKEEFMSCEFGGEAKPGVEISSPYWPSKYPSNAEGTWIIKVPFNHTVELTIHEFQLERDKKCFYDYIQIFDGNSTTSPVLLPRTCGTDAVNKTIKSTGTMMLVKFRSDRTVTFQGFNATWMQKVKPSKPIRYKQQNVLVTNVISCPIYNESLVPLGKATTCSANSQSKDCYFEMRAYLITCIIGIRTNRTDLPLKDSAKVNMTFKHIMHRDLFPSYYLMKKTCVTWNTSYTSSAWSRKGCMVKSTNISHTVCECDHTGIFAVLVTDQVVVHKKFSLLANTYAGIGVSFLIVIIAILHIVWKVDIHGGEAMRINMCVATILMMMTYLIGANVKAEKHLCGFLAFLEYFAVMSQFFWLMLHGLRIHGKIKEIFASGLNIEIVYVGFGWGLPLLLSLIAIGIQVDIKNPDAVCWRAIAGGSMWGYGAPLLIVILLNILVLCAVVAPTEERKTKYLYYPMMFRMMKDATLLALFGFTCIMAYLTVERETFAVQYFLTVSVVLQAVAMIVFGREGRKDYVRRDVSKMEHDNISENTNELSFGKFEDESSSSRSSRNSNKDPPSPEKKGMKLKSSKFQETDIDA